MQSPLHVLLLVELVDGLAQVRVFVNGHSRWADLLSEPPTRRND